MTHAHISQSQLTLQMMNFFCVRSCVMFARFVCSLFSRWWKLDGVSQVGLFDVQGFLHAQQSLNRDHRGNYHTIAVPLRVRFVSTKSIKQAANLRNQVIARLSAKSLTTITTNHQSFKHATSFDALRNLGRPSDSQYGGNQGCLSQIIQRNASRRGGGHGQHGSFQGNFTRREHFDQQDEKAGL